MKNIKPIIYSLAGGLLSLFVLTACEAKDIYVNAPEPFGLNDISVRIVEIPTDPTLLAVVYKIKNKTEQFKELQIEHNKEKNIHTKVADSVVVHTTFRTGGDSIFKFCLTDTYNQLTKFQIKVKKDGPIVVDPPSEFDVNDVFVNVSGGFEEVTFTVSSLSKYLDCVIAKVNGQSYNIAEKDSPLTVTGVSPGKHTVEITLKDTNGNLHPIAPVTVTVGKKLTYTPVEYWTKAEKMGREWRVVAASSINASNLSNNSIHNILDGKMSGAADLTLAQNDGITPSTSQTHWGSALGKSVGEWITIDMGRFMEVGKLYFAHRTQPNQQPLKIKVVIGERLTSEMKIDVSANAHSEVITLQQTGTTAVKQEFVLNNGSLCQGRFIYIEIVEGGEAPEIAIAEIGVQASDKVLPTPSMNINNISYSLVGGVNEITFSVFGLKEPGYKSTTFVCDGIEKRWVTAKDAKINVSKAGNVEVTLVFEDISGLRQTKKQTVFVESGQDPEPDPDPIPVNYWTKAEKMGKGWSVVAASSEGALPNNSKYNILDGKLSGAADLTNLENGGSAPSTSQTHWGANGSATQCVGDWITIDMGRSMMVEELLFAHRIQSNQQCSEIELRIGNSLGADKQITGTHHSQLITTPQTMAIPTMQNFPLSQAAKGRYLQIVITRNDHPATTASISISEIGVVGYPKN